MHLRCFLFLAAFSAGLLPLRAEPLPLIHAHAHNDYQHKRPLFDALDHGFCSVEADIWLVNGKLFVAHDFRDIKTNRTLESLYLDPLRERVKKNGGRVYPNGPEFTLLIDLKSHWTNTYPVLRGVLEKYSDMLTTFGKGKKKTNAIRVICTGSRDIKMFDAEKVRMAAFDGRFNDLDSKAHADLIPWISLKWETYFKWRGNGSMPDTEKNLLKDMMIKAHARDRKVRFWGASDNVSFWKFLLDNKVDLINTDDLDGVRKFLLKRDGQAVPAK